jgi:hypothetical protein
VSVAQSIGAVDKAAPFVNRSEMIAWLADGERGLWIQARTLEWFYARFGSICHGVNATNSLVFEAEESGDIGQRSSIVVPGYGRCAVQTLRRSDGPPKGRYAAVQPQPQSQ